MPSLGRAAWATGLVAALFAVAGCGGQAGQAKTAHHDPNPLPADTLTAPAESVGEYGGRFVLGQTAAPKTFNALMANESSSTDVTQRLYAALTDYDNGRQVEIPGIAKSWEVSPDGLTWTWHLRRGAKFSDGHLITSEDVLFCFQVVADPRIHPPLQDFLKVAGKPMEMSAPDSYTVVTKIASPYAMMVSTIGSLLIMPKHILQPAFERGDFASAYNTSTSPESLVTSGPWKVKQYLPGEKLVMSGNPYWYGVDVKGQRLPYLDELVFLIVPDQEAATLKFQAGELDALDNVKPDDYQAYADGQKQGKYTFYDLGPSINTNFMVFNLNTVKTPKPGKRIGDPYADPVKYAWFKNPTFRRAVSMAIDREAIIKSTMFGEGVKNWSSSTPANKLWYSPQIVGADHDPAGARKLLESLGFRDRDGDGVLEDAGGHSLRFTLLTNGDNKVRMAMCSFIKEDLAKIGIACTPTGAEFTTLVANMRENFQYDAVLLGGQSGVPPDPGMGQNVWKSSGPTHWWNMRQVKPETPAEARIDALMDACVGTIDMNKRQQAWRDLQKIVNDETFLIWLPTQRQKVPVRDRFGNVQPVIIPHRILWNIDRVYVKPAGRRA